MKTYLLGVDIGTSACKTALFRADGVLVASADAAYPVRYPQPGWAQQEPEMWWQGAVSAIRRLLEESRVRAEEIAGIGVDGQSWSMVPLDADGAVLYPSPIWTDCRARAECDDMRRAVGEEALFACSGNPVQPSYTLPKVLWLKKNEPELYRRTACVLQSNGYIVYRLTGERTQDVSQGYGWNCFDMRRDEWNRELAAGLGIDPGILPEICTCSQIVGGITAEAAAATGLSEGTPVVAGGLDAACSTLGVGVIGAGQTQEQGGQAGGMSICMDRYAADPALILSRHVVPERWLLQGGTTGGGGALKWLREQLCPEMSFDDLSRLAGQAPPGSGGVVFLPFMAGERSPLWNPDAKGVLYGLGFAAGRAQIVRAVMEGVAFSLRHNLEVARAAGSRIDVLRATGGSSQSAVWMQMKADITGCRIEIPEAVTAAARGAAILAGMGTGVYRSWNEAVQPVRVTCRYEPDAQLADVYQAQYGMYRQLIDALLPVMKRQENH